MGILPGLVGTIVGFIFKTVGSVIRFLGKSAWLLVLRVVVFIVERFQNKNKCRYTVSTWCRHSHNGPVIID